MTSITASAVATLRDVTLKTPTLPQAHWLLRLPLAGIMIQQGMMKFPLAEADATTFGVPLFLWALAAVGELAVGVGLLIGGVLRGWVGDLVTRAAGAAMAIIVASVLVVAYWAPPIDILLYNQFHVLLLVGGLYFALRGARA